MIWDIRRAFLFLYRCLFRRRQVSSHPFPEVTEEDVARIVRRDFPEEKVDAVMVVLNEYGIERSERGGARIYLATLKLANGNLERLKDQIKMAKSDWRGVLVAAERPESFGSGFRGRKLPVKEQQRLIESDSKQYEDWLRR